MSRTAIEKIYPARGILDLHLPHRVVMACGKEPERHFQRPQFTLFPGHGVYKFAVEREEPRRRLIRRAAHGCNVEAELAQQAIERGCIRLLQPINHTGKFSRAAFRAHGPLKTAEREKSTVPRIDGFQFSLVH